MSSKQPAKPTPHKAVGLVRREGSKTTIDFLTENVRLDQVGKALAVDYGRAVLRNSAPELQFCQLDPLAENVITRLLITRWDLAAFKATVPKIGEFLRDLEADLATTGVLAPSVDDAAVFGNASRHSEAAVTLVDVEVALFYRLGSRGAVLFLMAKDEAQKYSALRDGTGYFDLTPQLAVTMPGWALSRLLLSWQRLLPGIGA